MEGWIKLYRNLLSKPIWKRSTPEQKTILITLLMMANYKSSKWEFKGELITCEKGQLLTTIDQIVEAAGKGVSSQNVRTALQRFEKLGFLTNESTNKGRLITIENYTLYQCDDDDPNRQLTGNQQATNRQLTGYINIKNDKKNKNDKKEKKDINKYINIYNIPPTIDEVRAYCEERGNGVDPEEFVNFYQSKGWYVGSRKMKDWKAAVRTWERRSKNTKRESVSWEDL